MQSLSKFLHFTRKNNHEKSRYLCNWVTDLQEIWQRDEDCVCQVDDLYQINVKIKAVGQPLRLTDPFFITVRYREFSIFNMAVVRHLGFLK